MDPNQQAAGHLPPQSMAQGQQDVAAAIQALSNRFDRLENRQANFEISAINAKVFRVDFAAPLQPLCNVQTGAKIPNFPQDLTDLSNMHEGTADAILLELDIHLAAGTALATKKQTIWKKWVA
ncbi:hypothetical protein BR93DRAFT_927923 [Coniochaeta sp. PMI_546]|nr:hypothetical protein BR93DRAFT_927923 [Coniochaeta sp. PMI_546]